MAWVAVGIGANMGDLQASFDLARRELSTLLAQPRFSSIYRTAPLYDLDQPDFWNAVALGQSDLPPRRLLLQLKQIEEQAQRLHRRVNGPRELDLDLLAYGNLALQQDVRQGYQLRLPHPRLHERRFVLEPWLELDPAASIPIVGELAPHLEACLDQRLERHPDATL